MKNSKEIWKDYPLDFDFEGFQRLEFSNLGRVKSFTNGNPEGKIINGSLQSGYPVVRIRLFQKRSAAQERKLLDLKDQIAAHNAYIKSITTSFTAKELQKKELRIKLEELRKERDKLISNHKKYNQKYNNIRAINFCVLIHKAVAQLFLEKPEAHQKFIIHKDFDKLNNRADNLSWATQEELTDRQNKHPKVVMHFFNKKFIETKPNTKSSKLSENDVLYIKSKLEKGGITLRKLAEQFGVSDMQIYRIKSGENWSHVKTITELKTELHK